MRPRARVFKIIASSVGVVVLLGFVFHFAIGAFLNRFVRPKLEQAISAHLPGSSLQVGALRYDFWRNRLQCDSVAFTRPNAAPVSASSISATGVNWRQLLLGKRDPAQILSTARIEVTDLSAVLPEAQYRVQCGHLRFSVPDSEILARALTVQLAVTDETFFAAAPFRRPRYRVAVASFALRGVSFAELFNGQAYRARSLEVIGPVFESLVNRDKPVRPVTESPPMPHELLAAIPKPFRLEVLTITDGLIRYAARRSAEAEPGVLTFSAVQIRGKEIANAAAGGEAIALTAEGSLMNAATLAVQMRLPVAPGALAFHYAGKLGAMDLTHLDGYMDGAGRIRIRSGSTEEVMFDIGVVGGHARGTVRGAYRNLQVTVVDGGTGSERGVTNRVATVLANQLKVRDENVPDKAGALKAGKVDYARKPQETFLQFAWLALRTGVLDLISLQASQIP